MKTGLTVSRYLGTRYLINTLAILLGLLSLIYLFDTIELIRRASKNDSLPFSLVLQMGLLKLPEVGQILFPFAILFSAIFTFWQFNRRSELVILRASGFSVWQYLLPIIILSALLGFLQMSVINPVGAMFITKYEQLENQHLNKQDNQVALFSGGLWLKQKINDEKSNNSGTKNASENGYVILHARKIDQKNWTLKNVNAFYFEQNNDFLMRIDAQNAVLKPERWVFKEVTAHYANGTIRESDFFALPTHLTINDIEESFSSPESMSFWKLPAHIKTLENTGFDATRLRVHYHNLMSQPLFLASMVLLAAIVSMRPIRSGGTLILVSSGVFIGFTVFFFSSYLQALGASNQIPPALAAWSPSIICTLLGLSSLIRLEDG